MKTNTIYLSGSTFWGSKEYFEELPGVMSAEYGLMQSNNDIVQCNDWTARPSSYALGSSQCLKVIYDEKIIPLATLLEAFYETIDPFSESIQDSYDGGLPEAKIYFENDEDEIIIDTSIVSFQKRLRKATDELGIATVPVTIACLPAEGYQPAGEYAEDYIMRNAGEWEELTPWEADEFVEEHESEFNL